MLSRDLHMKDVEILPRIFAMLVDGENYTPSMMRFLNQFSKKCRTHTIQQNGYLERLFKSFLEATANLPDDVFLNKRNRRFNIALIEAVFTAVCETPFRERRMLDGKLQLPRIQTLEKDAAFIAATAQATTQTTNVRLRLERGKNHYRFSVSRRFMATTIVDRLYTEFREVIDHLGQEEISLQLTAEDNFRKALLMAAASYFEKRLKEHLTELVSKYANRVDLIAEFMRNKAIEHSTTPTSNGKLRNANAFFGLFGESFKTYMQAAGSRRRGRVSRGNSCVPGTRK